MTYILSWVIMVHLKSRWPWEKFQLGRRPGWKCLLCHIMRHRGSTVIHFTYSCPWIAQFFFSVYFPFHVFFFFPPVAFTTQSAVFQDFTVKECIPECVNAYLYARVWGGVTINYSPPRGQQLHQSVNIRQLELSGGFTIDANVVSRPQANQSIALHVPHW